MTYCVILSCVVFLLLAQNYRWKILLHVMDLNYMAFTYTQVYNRDIHALDCMTWVIMKMTASVFVLACWIVAQISAVKPNCSCWVHICCQYYLFPNLTNIFAKKCAIFPRKQQVAGVGIPVTRSLSGPITAWSPSAVNTILLSLELMSRFWACPWASFGPGMAKTTTVRIPEVVWKYDMEMRYHQNQNFLFLLYFLLSGVLRE